MRRTIRKAISLSLALVMLVSAAPTFAFADTHTQNTAAVSTSTPPAPASSTPEDINEVVGKFTEAMAKFTEDTSEVSQLSALITRFGGVGSAASGVIGILKMAGIVKDETMEKLGEILSEVQNVQQQLDEMDEKLNIIHSDLVEIAAGQEEKERNRKADTMQQNWEAFNTNYCDPLDKMINVYQTKINNGIKTWWNSSGHESVRLIYTNINGKPSLTYSANSYGDIPAAADNGEQVVMTIGIPSGILPDTSAKTFNIDEYKDWFSVKMADNFISAANEKKLDADEAFYAKWDSLSEGEKAGKAASYSNDILNTLIYHIACDVMEQNSEWVTEVVTAYSKYCDHLLKQSSGVDAMLNYMYLTHGFEGEIKDDVNTFCDAMIVDAGIYGQFALACVCQDRLQPKPTREKMQDYFTNTIKSLSEKKDLALTGYDNFCYITGTMMELGKVDATASTSLKHTSSAYNSYSSTDWSIKVPNSLNNVLAQVLYHQYTTLNQGHKTFASYLNSYGVLPSADYSGSVMTRYSGAQTFNLNENIAMDSTSYLGSRFLNAGGYEVNKDKSKSGDQYYPLHDKILCDMFDIKTGDLNVNQIGGARALYAESHDYWSTDEICEFHTSNVAVKRKVASFGGKTKNRTFNYTASFDILKLNPVHDINGLKDENDPFFAFDGPVFVDGVSDTMGPVADYTSTPVTKIKLKTSRFTYTGKAIKPSVTVYAGKKAVPKKGYKISYKNNKKIGIATITVKGKGKYSGTVTKTFRVIPKGTKIKRVKVSGTSAKVRWKKMAKKMSSTRISGYQIRYSSKSTMKSGKTVTVKGFRNTSKKLTGLKRHTAYYFQVRTYVKKGKMTVYSKWSKKVGQ